MIQESAIQELRSLSLEEVKAHKKKFVEHKAELEVIKAKGGKVWTDNLQEELEDVGVLLVYVDDIIEEKSSASKNR